MTGQTLGESVESFIAQRVGTAGTTTRYRRPLVGFADAGDPAWLRLREIAEPTHLLPTDLLPHAKTVVAFFLPFAEVVVRANREAGGMAREWAVAYIETNALINKIAEELIVALDEWSVTAAAQPATHNWDPVTLISSWSHKSAAAIAGLGSFGLHRMLITELGCAGRCGSLVIDAYVDPTSAPQPERCRFFYDEQCTYCVDECPVNALQMVPKDQMNLNKHGCHAHILEVKAVLGADCCGKCAVGPCALGSAASMG